MKAKRPDGYYFYALGIAALVSVAGNAHADSWEQALATCAPGSSFDACIKALKATNLPLQEEPLGDVGREVGFDLQPPFGGVSIRTFNGAHNRIVAVDIIVSLEKGTARSQVLSFFKSEAGSAKQDRASVAGAGQYCGADGWGVAWLGTKSDQPEIELQLNSPQASSPRDTDADRFKPEDALIKRQGDGVVHICFLMPKPNIVSNDFIDTPTLSSRLFKAFLQSPHFHGKASLKGTPTPDKPATREGEGVVALPPEAARALFDVYYVDPKEQAAFAATCNKRAADLNGDGKPEFVVELSMEGGSDGQAYCDAVLLGAQGNGYSYVADIDCCKYTMVPASGRKGGEIQCSAGKNKKTVFVWRGSWPRGADKRTTQTRVKADFDQGKALLKAGKLAEAKPLLCAYRNASGSSENPEFANGCATVLLRLNDTAGAERVLTPAVTHHPDYNAFYANLGTLWELKGDLGKAIGLYEQYVAAASPGPARDAIAQRIAALKKRK